MDLDKIKKEWQETSAEVNVDEDKIGQMINNQGQSAYRKFLNYERIGIILSILLWFASGVFRYQELKLFFKITVVIIFFWQIYKVISLSKVDLVKMSILKISRFYVGYKKIMIYEIVVSFSWFMCFVGFYGYLEYLHQPAFIGHRIFIFCIVFSIAFLIGLWLTWHLQWRHIRQLGRSIREIEELEKDNK